MFDAGSPGVGVEDPRIRFNTTRTQLIPFDEATGDCTTPDPFVTLGGGTCYNGAWLPPGMSPPPAPPPSSGGCTTPDPFASLPTLVGECRNGDWVPVPRRAP